MLEKLIKKYIHPPGKKPAKAVVISSNNNKNLRQREMELFGEERVNRQKLYEKWVVKESWQLYEEAIPLLFGIDPESNERFTDDENNFDVSITELGNHAKHCVEQGLLSVINKDSPDNKWRVKPIEIYKWAAVSRVELPEHLTMLMDFIQKTISENKPASVSNKTGIDPHIEHYDKDKEKVLGTALAILAANPESYRNEDGVVSAEKIVHTINEKGKFWFGDNTPVMTPAAMIDLINRWLRTIS